MNHNKFRCTHSWEQQKNMFFFPALLSPWFFPMFPIGIFSAPGGWMAETQCLIAQQKILGKDKKNNHTKTGWWFHFFYFHPKNWGRFPFWRAYFFRWVGSTTNHTKIIQNPSFFVEFCSSYNIPLDHNNPMEKWRVLHPQNMVFFHPPKMKVLGSHGCQNHRAQKGGRGRISFGEAFPPKKHRTKLQLFQGLFGHQILGRQDLGNFKPLPNSISDLLECRRITNIHHSAQRSFCWLN